MIQLTWSDFDAAVAEMALLIPPNIHSVFGVPRGGMPLAVALSHHARKQYVTRPPVDPDTRRGVLIIDDIFHTGETLRFLRKGVWHPQQPTLVWYLRRSTHSVLTLDDSIALQHVKEIIGEEWLCFPWENYDRASADEAAYIARHRTISL